MKHPLICLHRVAQWRWGATVRKPTGLLAVRLRNFSKSMYSRTTPGATQPREVAIGKDATGAFKTSAHKEYQGRSLTNLRETCNRMPFVYRCLTVLSSSGFTKLCKPRRMLLHRPSCQISRGVKFGHLLDWPALLPTALIECKLAARNRPHPP